MVLPLDTAQEKLLAAAAALPALEAPLGECWQRVLAEDVRAGTDFPPFDRSPLDGYAVVAAEAEGASASQPVWLRVLETVPAGCMPRLEVGPGTAARIMTGAPLPPGATGVVRAEDTYAAADRVAITAGVGAARNICRRGEEFAAGEAAVAAGTVINAGVMGMLALLGYGKPWIYRRPRVALLATGSEVRPVEAPLAAGTIRDSNSYMLAAQVAAAGAEAVLCGIAADDAGEIAAGLSRAAGCDIVVTTGGVSVGDYDLMPPVYRQAGIEVLFDRVAMKPGMPVLAGIKDGRLHIGLSGNPAAASVAFELLVRPVLLKMGGRRDLWRPRARARLAAGFGKAAGPVRFVWGRCLFGGGQLAVEPLALQGNGMLRSAAAADALIVIEAGSPPLPAGSEVEILILNNW